MLGMAMPIRGQDYPGSYAELRAWFPDDAACLDYLDWLRWPNGFVCPACGTTRSWRLADGSHSCAGCRRRISPTAGTIFHRTRTPLTVWFAAAWHITTQKNGISALGLKRVLGLGSYQSAWSMLHRYRSAMRRPGRDKLRGEVEVDETFVGGVKSGRPGRGALGKALVVVAVERFQPKGLGRCRMAIIPNARATSLRRFVVANVEPGSTVVTDGWPSYPPALAGYVHQPVKVSASGTFAHVSLPGVHRVAALLKRWLLGTHQGGVEADHLAAYLDEFVFRFNRRRSEARGLLFRRLLEHAVSAPPVPYRQLVVNPKKKRTKPQPPTSRRLPRSLVIDLQPRPWRQA
jgi:transposase-like protein